MHNLREYTLIQLVIYCHSLISDINHHARIVIEAEIYLALHDDVFVSNMFKPDVDVFLVVEDAVTLGTVECR